MTPGHVLAARYVLDQEIGAGLGVFIARDLDTGGRVAVKVFPAVASADAFRREASIAMRARHPNLVGLLDAGVTGAEGWIVSEYVPGIEVRDRLRSYGPMGVRRAVDVASQIFAALDALHRRGLFHGDIKPDNVLLDEGRVRVFDYGMASVHRALDAPAAGPFPGTPGYMHPALFHGGRPDARTDCFAAWVTTYELLAGRRPYTVRALRASEPLAAPASVGDDALDHLVAAGLSGWLPDARAAWLALTRFLRGRLDLPAPRPAEPPLPAEVGEALLRHTRDAASVAVVGPPELGRAALEDLHHAWVRAGGWALWGRAHWGDGGEPLSGALSLAVDAMDALGGAALARVKARLGPLGGALAVAVPAARTWLDTPAERGSPDIARLEAALVALFDACPRPLLVLVDGLDRLDAASRRFLGEVDASGSVALVATTAAGVAHGLRATIVLPEGEAVALDLSLRAEDAEVLAAARSLGLPFGPRLATAIGVSPERLLDAALEAEARGAARWDGTEVVPRPGPTSPR